MKSLGIDDYGGRGSIEEEMEVSRRLQEANPSALLPTGPETDDQLNSGRLIKLGGSVVELAQIATRVPRIVAVVAYAHISNPVYKVIDLLRQKIGKPL